MTRAALLALATVLLLGCTGAGYGPVEQVPIAALGPDRTPQPPAGPPLSLTGAAVQGGVVRGVARPDIARLTLDGVPVLVAPDRSFLFALDRDAPTSAVLEAHLANGSVHRQTVAVAPRSWRIERLPNLPRVAQPSAEFQRRRPAELAQIAAARATQTPAAGWRQPFGWPATGRISGRFGSQRVYAGEPAAYHSGVDVAAGEGAPVVAPADGVVVLAAAAPFTLEGNLLMLDHGAGLNSAFLHLRRIDVKLGDVVRRGQRVAEVGRTGRATGPHLHWGMKWHGARIDPEALAGAMPR